MLNVEKSSWFLELVLRCFIVSNDHRTCVDTIQYTLESVNKYAEMLMHKSTTIRISVSRALSKKLDQCMIADKVTCYKKRGALGSKRIFPANIAVSYDRFIEFQIWGGGILGYHTLDDRMWRVVTCCSSRYQARVLLYCQKRLYILSQVINFIAFKFCAGSFAARAGFNPIERSQVITWFGHGKRILLSPSPFYAPLVQFCPQYQNGLGALVFPKSKAWSLHSNVMTAVASA